MRRLVKQEEHILDHQLDVLVLVVLQPFKLGLELVEAELVEVLLELRAVGDEFAENVEDGEERVFVVGGEIVSQGSVGLVGRELLQGDVLG